MELSNKKLRFGTAGVRAKINELTPKEAYEIVFKVAQYFGNKVVIARDARNNGKALIDAVEASLLYLGKEVYNIDISPTPTAQYYLEKKRRDMGVVITASHNPPEWNGIKIIKKNNVVLSKEEGNPILDSDTKDEINPHNKVVLEDANSMHAKALANYWEGDLNIVVDYGNGVGKLVFGKALDMLKIRRKEINEKLDGNFPGRNSEPTERNIKELIKIMERGEDDIGIAFDGDADRVVFVDEKGNFVSGDKAFAILSKYIIKDEGDNSKRRNEVVSTVATSRVVEDAVKEVGGSTYYVKVGTTYIAQGILDRNAIIGGEEAGGIMYPKEHLGKDGMLTAMLMLKIMNKHNKKLSTLVDELPKYYSIKEKISITYDKKQVFMKKFIPHIKEVYKEGKTNEVDGIRIDFQDAWFIVRPSGTENYIRLFVEAKNEKEMNKLRDEVKNEIMRFI